MKCSSAFYSGVQIGNKVSEHFEFNAGLNKGNGLFVLGLHYVIKDLDQSGAVFNETSHIFIYSDDIVIKARCKKLI